MDVIIVTEYKNFGSATAEVNQALRPLIVERAEPGARGQGWRSANDFESWAGEPLQTLHRVARDLADSLTTTRSGGRVHLDWIIRSVATVRTKGEYCELGARPGELWPGSIGSG